MNITVDLLEHHWPFSATLDTFHMSKWHQHAWQMAIGSLSLSVCWQVRYWMQICMIIWVLWLKFVALDCGNISSGPEVVIEPFNNTLFNATINFHCEEGLIPNTTMVAVCGSTGVWSHNPANHLCVNQSSGKQYKINHLWINNILYLLLCTQLSVLLQQFQLVPTSVICLLVFT